MRSGRLAQVAAPGVVWCAAAASVALAWVTLASRSASQRIDFHIYVDAVDRLGAGGLYTTTFPGTELGFTYPPFAAVVLWPLAQLPEGLAEQLWLGLSLACSIAFLWIVARWAGREAGHDPGGRLAPLVVGIGVWTVPVYLTARIGQINAIIALLMVVDLVAVRRGARGGGVGIGLAGAIKLTPLVSVVYLAIAGRFRAAVTAVTCAVGVTLAAAALLPNESREYFTDLLFDSRRVGELDSPYNNSLRKIVSFAGMGDPAETLVWAALVAVVVVVACRRAWRLHRRGSHLAAATMVILMGYLVAPITWGHHLAFAIPAALLLILNRDSLWARMAGLTLALLLIDPVAAGEWEPTAVARSLLMLAVVVAAPFPTSGRRSTPGRTPSASARRIHAWPR